MTLSIRAATRDDLDLIFRFICDLAEYERLRDEVYADVETLGVHLFGPHPMAEVLIKADLKPGDTIHIGFNSQKSEIRIKIHKNNQESPEGIPDPPAE